MIRYGCICTSLCYQHNPYVCGMGVGIALYVHHLEDGPLDAGWDGGAAPATRRKAKAKGHDASGQLASWVDVIQFGRPAGGSLTLGEYTIAVARHH